MALVPLKKTLRVGQIQLDIPSRTINVHFEFIVILGTQDGKPLDQQVKPGMQRLAVPEHTAPQIPAVARELCAQCKFLPESKAPVLEDLLKQLAVGENLALGTAAGSAHFKAYDSTTGHVEDTATHNDLSNSIDEAVSALYNPETIVAAAQQLAGLAASGPHALIAMLEHQVLLNVLQRTIKEDGKKNPEFLENAMAVVFSLSMYHDLHERLASAGIGDTCVRVAAFEIKRHQARITDLKQHRDAFLAARATGDMDSADIEERAVRVAQHRLIKGAENQDHILFFATHTLFNLSKHSTIEAKLVRARFIRLLVSILLRAGQIKGQRSSSVIVACNALAKLSVTGENLNELAELKAALHAIAASQCTDEGPMALLPAARLAYNLSLAQNSLPSVAGKRVVEFGVKALKTSISARDAEGATELGAQASRLIYSLAREPALARSIAVNSDLVSDLLEAALSVNGEARMLLCHLLKVLSGTGVTAEALLRTSAFNQLIIEATKANDVVAISIIASAVHVSPYSAIEVLCGLTPGSLAGCEQNDDCPVGDETSADFSFIEKLVRSAASSENPAFLCTACSVVADLSRAARVVFGRLPLVFTKFRLLPRLLELIPFEENACDVTYVHLPAATAAAGCFAALVAADPLLVTTLGLQAEVPDSDEENKKVVCERCSEVASCVQSMLAIATSPEHPSHVAHTAVQFATSVCLASDARALLCSQPLFARRLSLLTHAVFPSTVRDAANSLLNLVSLECSGHASARFVVHNFEWLQTVIPDAF